MPDDAGRLINAAPTSTPCSETEVYIFAICRSKESVKTSQFEELVSVHSHKATGSKQSMTSLLNFRIEVPTIKAVFEFQAGRTTRNRCSVPIVAPRRNGKNIGRLEMPN